MAYQESKSNPNVKSNFSIVNFHFVLRYTWSDRGSGWDDDVTIYPIEDSSEAHQSGCFKVFGNYNYAAYQGEPYTFALKKEACYEATNNND